MTEPKTYDCRAAIVAMALAFAAGEKPNLRDKLKALSDIPDAKLDFASHEIGQMLDGLQILVALTGVAAGGDEAAERDMIERSIGKVTWIDDVKREFTLNAFKENEQEGDPLSHGQSQAESGG